MAAYHSDHSTTNAFSNPDDALNAVEAILEALDSTDNPLWICKVIRDGNAYKGIVLYRDIDAE